MLLIEKLQKQKDALESEPRLYQGMVRTIGSELMALVVGGGKAKKTGTSKVLIAAQLPTAGKYRASVVLAQSGGSSEQTALNTLFHPQYPAFHPSRYPQKTETHLPRVGNRSRRNSEKK